MKSLILIFTLVSPLFASSSHHGQDKHEIKPYNNFVLTEKVKKKATAVYHCTCESRVWKQSASKTKACPYCGPAMPQCGHLEKVLPTRNVKYSWDEYDLPNTICPVSEEPVKNQNHYVEIEGKRIYVCCKKCVNKFNKKIVQNKADRYLRKLPLKPAKFGFSKVLTKQRIHHENHGHEGHGHEGHNH